MPDGPKIGILVGSESDRERMQGAMALLDEAGVGYEFEVRSAHRTPEAVAEYARSARARGLRVLICGAGLSAALPGAVAAHTDLPVIGVPLRSSLSVLDGLDALLAIAQMPPGVPVAAVGVDNAKNAAALALRILNALTLPERRGPAPSIGSAGVLEFTVERGQVCSRETGGSRGGRARSRRGARRSCRPSLESTPGPHPLLPANRICI